METAYLFGQVAHAIGSSPKSLRNWMQRAQISFDKPNVAGWRRFTEADVARLAIMRHLVDAAVPVGYADAIVRGLPRDALLDYSQRDDLLVWWISDIDGPDYSRTLVENGSSRPYWDIIAQTNCQNDAPKPFGMLEISPVIARAMRRLSETPEGGADA
jgi:DNA-binding transcriptional MerR regulator